MADFASNCPVSGPRGVDWKMTWDLGGMAWSYEWGMFYNTGSTDDMVPMRKPTRPDSDNRV